MIYIYFKIKTLISRNFSNKWKDNDLTKTLKIAFVSDQGYS